MPARLHEIAGDRRLAQLLACFQPVQPFHQHEAITVLTYQDRALLADLQDAFGDRLSLLRVERRPASTKLA